MSAYGLAGLAAAEPGVGVTAPGVGFPDGVGLTVIFGVGVVLVFPDAVAVGVGVPVSTMPDGVAGPASELASDGDRASFIEEISLYPAVVLSFSDLGINPGDSTAIVWSPTLTFGMVSGVAPFGSVSSITVAPSGFVVTEIS